MPSADGLTLEPDERVNDESIARDTLLWRLIDKPYWIKRDELGVPLRRPDGCLKISGESFNTEEVSVRLSDRISFADLRAKYPDIPIAQITAADVRADNCIIARDTNDESHGLIYDKDRPGEVELRINRARRFINKSRIMEP